MDQETFASVLRLAEDKNNIIQQQHQKIQQYKADLIEAEKLIKTLDLKLAQMRKEKAIQEEVSTKTW